MYNYNELGYLNIAGDVSSPNQNIRCFGQGQCDGKVSKVFGSAAHFYSFGCLD